MGSRRQAVVRLRPASAISTEVRVKRDLRSEVGCRRTDYGPRSEHERPATQDTPVCRIGLGHVNKTQKAGIVIAKPGGASSSPIGCGCSTRRRG
jgi:hypothetical protein